MCSIHQNTATLQWYGHSKNLLLRAAVLLRILSVLSLMPKKTAQMSRYVLLHFKITREQGIFDFLWFWFLLKSFLSFPFEGSKSDLSKVASENNCYFAVLNPFQASVAVIWKLVQWFPLQISGLLSVYLQHWTEMGFYFYKNFFSEYQKKVSLECFFGTNLFTKDSLRFSQKQNTGCFLK